MPDLFLGPTQFWCSSLLTSECGIVPKEFSEYLNSWILEFLEALRFGDPLAVLLQLLGLKSLAFGELPGGIFAPA